MATPTANRAVNTSAPISVAWISLWSTAPPTIAGTATTGIASTTANTSRLVAVSAEAEVARSRPDCTSIRYCSAAPIAPPPGATFASALPASWDVATDVMSRVCRAIRCRSHRQTRDSSCRPAMAASQPAAMPRTWSASFRVSRTVGPTRYSDTPHTVSQKLATTRRRRTGAGAVSCSSSSASSARSSIARSTRSPSWPRRLTELTAAWSHGRTALLGGHARVHIHDAQPDQGASTGQGSAQGRDAGVLPGGQDRRAGRQRRRQVHAAADHGRRGHRGQG